MVEAEPLASRNLTRNEVRVVQTILGSPPLAPEEDRIRHSGLPRSTYQAIRQRLYGRGILEDRFVPSAPACGVQKVSFLLVRPFADKTAQVTELLCALPGAAVVWEGMHSVFGVVFRREGENREAVAGTLRSVAELGTTVIHVPCDPLSTHIPVYFDYEGGWNHFIGVEGTARYPRGFPVRPPPRLSWTRSSRGVASTAEALVKRPFAEGDSCRLPHLVTPSSLPRSQRRLLAEGFVEWRAFLSPGKVPRYNGSEIGDLIFLAGRLREPSAHGVLLRQLAGADVNPFLLASDGSRVLLGMLGIGLRGGTVPRRRTGVSVLGLLNDHLDEIEMARDPFLQVSEVRSHRYERLFTE